VSLSQSLAKLLSYLPHSTVNFTVTCWLLRYNSHYVGMNEQRARIATHWYFLSPYLGLKSYDSQCYLRLLLSHWSCDYQDSNYSGQTVPGEMPLMKHLHSFTAAMDTLSSASCFPAVLRGLTLIAITGRAFDTPLTPEDSRAIPFCTHPQRPRTWTIKEPTRSIRAYCIFRYNLGNDTILSNLLHYHSAISRVTSS
jgi:hypothetical protein